MKQPLLLAMVTLAFSTVAGAATYKMKLLDSIAINGRELKPGDYKLEVNDMTAVIRNGRDCIEVKVKIETIEKEVRFNCGPVLARRREEQPAGNSHRWHEDEFDFWALNENVEWMHFQATLRKTTHSVFSDAMR